MSSIPTSPTSPIYNRRSIRLSSFDVLDTSPSPYTSGTTNGTTFSRRSSRTSQTSFMQSPVTPRPTSVRSSRPSSFYDRRKSSSRLSIGSNISLDAHTGGLGNLADELEYALEDEYDVNGSGFLDDLKEGSTESIGSAAQSPYLRSGPQSPTYTYETSQSFPQSPSKRPKNRHQRTESRYKGSKHEPESDEEDGITPALARRIRDIESMARLDLTLDDMLSEEGGVIARTIHALKELDPQAGIEANLSRIISAYTSMAAHRTHKTRDLFSQAHSLLYGKVFDLPEDILDALMFELETLSSATQLAQQQNPLTSLQALASQTLDLAHTLRMLTDALQEFRIQSNAASRKLKSVKDMVEDICIEQELIETSMMLIQAGDWDRRCRERQAAATCREVVLGFGDRWDLEVDDRPWTRECDGVV